MKSNYYEIYIQKVLQLAETIVIKSDITAETLNKYVTDYHGAGMVDKLDPRSWKYYLNLSGEYHPIDEAMSVVSLDTLETILFSKENLQVHRATARGYAYGTRHYRELVAQYPKQEMLILGILHPVDIDTAIAAPDGKILGYPPGLVEYNEYSLIANLQKWIDGFKVRWVNQQFSISDDLYAATSLGVMYLNLVPAIIALRLEACKTNEAHSFHVRQYLASHGLLDAYVDSMTLKQALFFYRNIAYIERNVGKRNIFTWLVEHIMTDRGLPLSEFTMRHNVANQPAEVYPTPVFRRTPINLEYSQTTETISLSQILNKEDRMARDNMRYRSEYEPVIQEQMENSLSSVVLTKMLESSMVDTSDSAPHTLEEILFSEWLHLSVNGNYEAYVAVTNPKSGERIPLTVKDAYTFVWYAFCRSIGIELIYVPKVIALHAQRIPTPTVDQIMEVVDPVLVSRETAEQALSMQPKIESIISTEAFYDLCVKIYQAGQMQRNLIAYQEHATRRAMVQNMCASIYSDNVCELEPANTTYASWFSERNLKIDEFTIADLGLVYVEMVQEATGASLHPKSSLKAMQAAMIKMLTQLSSYSIQIVSDINMSEVKKTDWTAVRVGDVDGSTTAEAKFPDMAAEVQAVDGTSATRVILETTGLGVHQVLKSSSDQRERVEIKVELEQSQYMRSRADQLQVAVVRARGTLPVVPVGENVIPVFGLETYFPLSQQQRQELKDIYNTGLTSPQPEETTDIKDILPVTELQGLTWAPEDPPPAAPAPTPAP